MLEIGPGLGFLTMPLLDAGAKVLAVEIDDRLLELLIEMVAEQKQPDVGEFSSLHIDCLAGKHELAPEVLEQLPQEGPWRLVSNLPYSVSAPVLAVLAGLHNPPVSMTVLVQLEVAERICAEPGSKNWGPISAKLQASYEVEKGRTVGPGMFWPRPKVDSGIAHLRRLAETPTRAQWQHFSQLVSALFSRRRQGLGRVWGDMLQDREVARQVLEELGIDAKARAENLSMDQLRALAERSEWKSPDKD